MTRTGATVRFVGVAAATVGTVAGTVALRRSRRLRTRLFDLEVDAETAAVRARLREAEERRQRHALANALTAVEGAALILERETLSASDRESLRRVLESGLDRLRRLGVENGASARPRVALAEVARRLGEDPRWSERARVDVPADLVAAGSLEETLEAASQLVAYLGRRAAARPFTVRGERGDGWSVLWIEEDGAPGTGRARGPVLDPEVRRSNDPDELSVHVASRLVRGEGGELRIVEGPGGGWSYGICLPAAGDE